MGFGRVLGDFSDRARNLMNSLGGASSSSAIGGTPSFGFGQNTSRARTDSSAVEHMIEQRAVSDNPFTTTLAQIEVNPKVNKTDNIEVKLRLPKPPAQMSKADYDKAYLKELFHRAGYSNITDGELAAFQSAVIKYTGEPFGLAADVSTLREIHGRTGHIESTTSEWRQAVVDAGAREIYRQRDEWTTAVDAAQAKSREYGTAALKGWAALHTNAPVNLINGLSEPVRGLAALGGAYIPSVPRWEAMEKSEYWQAGNKGQVAEVAGTLTAGALAGGASVLATTPGKVIATLEATYNIGVGAAGVDPTQGNREMSPLERTTRIVGGAVTAAGVSQTLGGAKSTGASTAAEAEAVTAEGVRVRVPHTDEPSVNTHVEMRGIEQGRRNVEMHEAKPAVPELGHTNARHIGKSESWLRKRLDNDTKLKAASSFRNEEVANRVQGQFVKQNSAEIKAWLKSGKPKFQGTAIMDESVGIVLRRGKGGSTGVKTAVETNKATAVLVRDNSLQGWHFKTSFPSLE